MTTCGELANMKQYSRIVVGSIRDSRILFGIWGYFYEYIELREITTQNKLAEWAGKITACRNSGQPVKTWCKENGVCEQTYYKWLKRLVTMAQEQQKVQFAEVTPSLPTRSGNVAVSLLSFPP